MKIAILDKYLSKQIIQMILLVSLALLGLDLLFSLVTELKMVGRGFYTISSALSYLFLTLASRFYGIFPWAALLGTIISLGVLANHRELVVMRSSSISVKRIAGSVLKGTVLLTCFMVIVGEGLAPVGEKMAQAKRTFALSGGQSIQTAQGLWVKQGSEFIHIKTIRSAEELLGVTRYLLDNQRRLKEVSFAVSAKKTSEGWKLHQIQGTQFAANKTKFYKKKEWIVPNILETEVLETASVKHPERLSLAALWKTIEFHRRNELNHQNYVLAFWTKISHPFLILLMAFLAIPFVFGPLRQANMGLRIVAGIGIAFVFYTVNGLFVPLAVVNQVPPVLAVCLPILLFGSLGYGLLSRVK